MASTYPTGFYLDSMEEYSTFYYFELNRNPVPEIKFNDYVYFYSSTGRSGRKVVGHHELRDIVANPELNQHKLNNLLMVNEEGVVFPAHLPNIADVVGHTDVQAIIRQLEQHPAIEYEGTTKIIPKLLINLVDPKPVIPREGPIYTLKMHSTSTHFGSYSDCVQFLRVGCVMSTLNFSVFCHKLIEDDPSSRYQGVRLQPEQEPGSKALEEGSSIVLWNVRRLTRPSFILHFREIVTTNNPIIIILTEIGASSTSSKRALGNLGTTMCWKVDVGGGLLGGSAVLWDPTRMAASVTVAESPNIDLRLIGCVAPVVC